MGKHKNLYNNVKEHYQGELLSISHLQADCLSYTHETEELRRLLDKQSKNIEAIISELDKLLRLD